MAVEGVYADDVLTYTYKGKSYKATVASDGTIQNAPTFTNVADSADVSVTVTRGSVTSEPKTATMAISRRAVVLTSGSATKIFDGAALTNNDFVVTGDGFVGNESVNATFTGSQTVAGSSQNTFTYTLVSGALRQNYDIATIYGTLTVTAQSITPGTDPDNPDPSYAGVTVDSPSDVPYNGTDQTWVPTVTTEDGTELVAGTDYDVTYSTDDRTNVTGTITVTITGKGNYTGTVTRTYQINPLTIKVTPDDQTKYVGATDPALTSTYDGFVSNQEAGWTGALTREPGEAVGTYAITRGTLALADNPDGNFLAQNYTLVVNTATFTIVAAPVTPGDGGTTTPATPATPDGGAGTGTVTPTPGTPAPAATLPTTGTDDAATDAADEETVTDDTTPLASAESIEDDATPLAAGDQQDNCWVHWIILVGMILTAVYFVGVSIRRRKFTAELLDYEDKVLGNNRDNR